MVAARAATLWLHSQAQTESRQDRRERIETWITPGRQGPIQGLAGQPCLARKGCHTSDGIRHSSKGDGYRARVPILEHRLNVGGDLDLASQMLRRSERAAWACGLCSLSSMHVLARYLWLGFACRHHTGAG